MIKQILSGKTCAACRMCCVFDRYDIWETPVFDEKTVNAVLERVSGAPFVRKGSDFVLNAGELADGDLYNCPALTPTGCFLGDSKPFDCRIWPFRIMNKDGSRIIAVAKLCDEVHDQDHDSLRDFLRKGLAKEIFAYADAHPDAVKPFYENYTPLIDDCGNDVE